MMHYCPCCRDTLLCHISHNHVYWFCPSCWQEMPVCDLGSYYSLAEAISSKVSKIHQKLEQPALSSQKVLINNF